MRILRGLPTARGQARGARARDTGARGGAAGLRPGAKTPAMPGPVRQSGGRHRTPAQKPYDRPRGDAKGGGARGSGGAAAAPSQVMAVRGDVRVGRAAGAGRADARPLPAPGGAVACRAHAPAPAHAAAERAPGGWRAGATRPGERPCAPRLGGARLPPSLARPGRAGWDVPKAAPVVCLARVRAAARGVSRSLTAACVLCSCAVDGVARQARRRLELHLSMEGPHGEPTR